MSGQLESRHYFRERDTVQHRDGATGTVIERHALYALIAWSDGRCEEIDQFDPAVVVLERANPE